MTRDITEALEAVRQQLEMRGTDIVSRSMARFAKKQARWRQKNKKLLQPGRVASVFAGGEKMSPEEYMKRYGQPQPK